MAKKESLICKNLKRAQRIVSKISMFPINKRKLFIRLALLAIILLGLGLRFYELSERPFLADEGISTMAAIDISETGYPPTHPDGTEYWRSIVHTSLMAQFFEVFGISVFVARLPSILFGTLAIILIYLFGKELFNWKVGLISAFLLSINTPAIDLSREARMYAMFQFFYLLSLYFFYKGFEANKGRKIKLFKGMIIIENIRFIFLLLFAVSFIISLLCHRGTIMIIPSIMGYAFVMGLAKRKHIEDLQGKMGKYFGTFLLLIVLAGVGLLTTLFLDFGSQISSLLPYIGFNVKTTISETIYYSLFFIETFPMECVFFGMALVFIGYIRNKVGLFLLAFFLIPLILQLLFFHFEFIGFKYVFHLIPLFLVLSAFGLYELVNRLKIMELIRDPHNINPRFFVVILSVLLVLAGTSFAYFETHRGKMATPYWRQACEYVLFNSEDDTALVTSVALIPQFYLGSEDYGLMQDHPAYVDKNITIYDRPHLHTREDLENITRLHDNGWVLVDMDRWNFEAVITESAKEFLRDNMTFHHYESQVFLFIYSWGPD
jgi:4-amino-4-deoxy-L-arabinose transferase-like glycosyltransferase